MKSDTTSVRTAVSALDTYLEIKDAAKSSTDELIQTKSDISTLKSEIDSLKRNVTRSLEEPQTSVTI